MEVSIRTVHPALHENRYQYMNDRQKSSIADQETKVRACKDCAPIGSHHLPIRKRSFLRMKKIQSGWTRQLKNLDGRKDKNSLEQAELQRWIIFGKGYAVTYGINVREKSNRKDNVR